MERYDGVVGEAARWRLQLYLEPHGVRIEVSERL